MNRAFRLIRALAVSFALAALADGHAAAQTCSPTWYIRPPAFPTGIPPAALALGDFNGDSHLDAAVTGWNDNLLRVLLGDGSGGFSAPVTSVSEYNSGLIATGFFDAGEDLDVAILVTNGVIVLLGNGDGTFGPPTLYPTDYSQYGLVVADFTGDGASDLAVLSVYGSKVFIFVGQGDGTFASGDPLVPGSTAAFLAAGDFNDDGDADLVLTHNSNAASVYLSLGDGTFGSPTTVKIGSSLGAVVAGDFDGDGLTDFAAIQVPYVAVVKGNGDGTFRAAVEYPAGSGFAIAAGDFDGDGLQDLAALREGGSYSAGKATILRQRPDGAMEVWGAWGAGAAATAFAAGDVDGDGRDDLVDADYSRQTISVLFAEGGGSFRGNAVVAVPSPPIDLASGDFDGNGRTDLAVLGPDVASAVTVLTKGDDGRFGVLATSEASMNAARMATGDFDGDGRPDLAFAATYNGMAVMMNRGDGTFEPPVFHATAGHADFVATGRFDGDENDDVAVVELGFANGQVRVFLGQGNGTFVPGPSTSLLHSAGSLIASDLDLDGDSDLVTTNACCGQPNAVAILLGNGDGSFATPVEYPTGPGPSSVAVVRLNSQDTFPDLVVANSGSTSISVLINDWDGGFGPLQIVGIGWTPYLIAGGDLDYGFGDVVTVNLDTGNISFLSGTGDGGFQAPVTYPVGMYPYAIAVGNFSGGLVPDLAVGSQFDSSVSIVRSATLFAAILPPAPSILGSEARLEASANGYGPLQYQWMLNGAPITEGGRYSGTTTAELTIADVGFADETPYTVVVSDLCTSYESPGGGASVEFGDVPASNIFHDDILTIARAGITAGCGGPNYCPDDVVTRAQMAVFLLKASEGDDHTPPPCTGIFGDVPCPSPFADWIEEAAALGITAGCGNGNYCPDAPVTRAQMAAMILKTAYPGQTPPQAVGIFADVPVGSFAADWIEALYEVGGTGGCGLAPLRYCPSAPVTRGQMAALIVNLFFSGTTGV